MWFLKISLEGDESEEESTGESDDDDDDDDVKKGQVDEALVAEVTQLAERRKLFLLTKVSYCYAVFSCLSV